MTFSRTSIQACHAALLFHPDFPSQSNLEHPQRYSFATMGSGFGTSSWWTCHARTEPRIHDLLLGDRIVVRNSLSYRSRILPSTPFGHTHHFPRTVAGWDCFERKEQQSGRYHGWLSRGHTLIANDRFVHRFATAVVTQFHDDFLLASRIVSASH